MNQISLAYLTVYGLAPPDHVTVAAKAGYDAVGVIANPPDVVHVRS